MHRDVTWIRRGARRCAALGLAAGCTRAAAGQGDVPARARDARRRWRRRSRAAARRHRSPSARRSAAATSCSARPSSSTKRTTTTSSWSRRAPTSARRPRARSPRAKVFATVAPTSVVVDPDWILDGFVGALYGDGRNIDKPDAVLVDHVFPAPAGRRRAACRSGSKTYERRVPFTTGSAGAYVPR